MKNRIRQILQSLFLMLLILMLCCGCVNQHPQAAAEVSGQSSGKAEELTEIKDPDERKAVARAKKLVAAGKDPRLIATSPATADICGRLNLDLVGVCSTTVSAIPERYKDLPQVGVAMSPDMEKIASLRPDWILGPASLQSDHQPKYDNIGVNWAFLNLRSVPGMYRSILELGEIFGREKEAEQMNAEFTKFYADYRQQNQGREHPKVLILMGLPGSYVIATEHSYVGSLAALAGAENVYAGEEQEFLTVNTEDMKKKEPDIILRTSHAMPDKVIKMFKKDFETNDIWKHFAAVRNGRVYDLTYGLFGMSATFGYPEALAYLQPILYPDSAADTRKAQEESRQAGEAAETSGGEQEYKDIQKGAK